MCPSDRSQWRFSTKQKYLVTCTPAHVSPSGTDNDWCILTERDLACVQYANLY
jgi:hypothetical protein